MTRKEQVESYHAALRRLNEWEAERPPVELDADEVLAISETPR